MSYSVQYPTGIKNKYPQSYKKQKSGVLFVIGCAAVMLLFIVVSCYLPNIRKAVLPGDPDVTEQAIATMVKNFREGQGIQTCFAEFCREVISAGKASLS